MDRVKTYTVNIFTENQIGLLAQISNIFTRRSLSIWNLYACATSIEGIHTITIVTDATEKRIEEVVFQLEKKVDVVKVYTYDGVRSVNDILDITLEKVPEVRCFLKERDMEKERILNK
ncbi:MAG: hypothetical protein HUJ92_04010 [Bacteroidales bacterium]|nr:hypothetical protein [Bacteroidales bacterium]